MLDAGGTLFHLARPVGHIYAEVASRYGSVADGEQLQQRFQLVWENRSATIPGSASVATPEEERTWWREVVWEVFEPESGIKHFDRFFTELHELFAQPQLWRLYPEVPGTLRRLREAGLKLAIVSNWDSRLEKLCRSIGIDEPFDCIVASAVAGSSKPSPKIFELALAKLGVSPEEAMHVGDSWRDDVWGAFQLGLTPVWLRRQWLKGEEGEEERPVIEGHRVMVAASLDEAVGLVIS